MLLLRHLAVLGVKRLEAGVAILGYLDYGRLTGDASLVLLTFHISILQFTSRYVAIPPH